LLLVLVVGACTSVSEGIMGFAGLTAKKEGIDLPPPKKQRTARAPPTGSVAVLNRDFVIFAKKRIDLNAKMTASLMLRTNKIVACARQTDFPPASEKNRESPHFDMTA
jgi:hypothetical protein